MLDCPHCHAVCEFQGAFCASCGKALPSPIRTPPRVIHDADLAATSLGQALQSEDLSKTARAAFTALIVVGVLQFLSGVALYFMGRGDGTPPAAVFVAVAIVAVIGTVFLALGVWAKFNPLPAAIAGLTLYVSLVALEFILSPSSISHGIYLRVVVIGVLARAVKAGLKHRELCRLATAA